MEPAHDLGRLPATQDEFESWCLAFDGSELGRFEFLYGCVVAEPPAGWPHARRRAITVIARDADGRLGAERTVTGDEPARSVLLDGFSVRPAEIFP